MKPLAANSLLQNRYLIIHHIGKGGMGEVYLSVDQRLGNPVALKRTVFRDDAMMWDAFEREARILARLRHPVLPKVSDHFSEKEEQYLVMEYISGDDLSKRLDAAKKPFPLQWVLYWADELLDALSYLHTHEPPIIHRDIKPQNLKLTSDNHVVLLDFGLAKNSVATKAHLSSSGSLVGYTPHYAPIEQVRGTGTSARSDIYSLSATLYQLLTGTVPVDALTRAESVVGGSGDSLPSPSEIVPEVSNGISSVILRGMALNSEQRYADAREMQKALREAYALHQQTAGAEPFDGTETLVPEAKASAPDGSLSGTKKEAFIFNQADVDGMFTAAQEPPPTLTAEQAASNQARSQPQNQQQNQQQGQPPVDFTATIPAEQWSEGETQGFSHDEMRRSTVDEEAFKQFGFDAEAPTASPVPPAPAAKTNGADGSVMPPPYLEQTTAQGSFENAPAEPVSAEPLAGSAERSPIRPVTTPLDPTAKPLKKASSGWGIKLVGIAAVLCFLVAAVGAAGWYAVHNDLIKIPGLGRSGQLPAANDNKTNPLEVKKSEDPAGDVNSVNSISETGKKDANEVSNSETGDARSNSAERKTTQPVKSATSPKKTETRDKAPKGKANPNEILQ